jgi:hypothetical protein
MTESSARAPAARGKAPVRGQGVEVWPHPYQVDRVGSVCWTNPPAASIDGQLRFSVDCRCSPLLVSDGSGRLDSPIPEQDSDSSAAVGQAASVLKEGGAAVRPWCRA